MLGNFCFLSLRILPMKMLRRIKMKRQQRTSPNLMSACRKLNPPEQNLCRARTTTTAMRSVQPGLSCKPSTKRLDHTAAFIKCVDRLSLDCLHILVGGCLCLPHIPVLSLFFCFRRCWMKKIPLDCKPPVNMQVQLF